MLRPCSGVREKRSDTQKDFLTVGGMGHASSIALGVSLGRLGNKILCLDGDGAMLMHMGNLPIINSKKIKGFLHVILNNSAHESVGGQPTVAGNMDFKLLSKSCGYSFFDSVKTIYEIEKAFKKINKLNETSLLEIKVALGSRKNLKRPVSSPIENKESFISKNFKN